MKHYYMYEAEEMSDEQMLASHLEGFANALKNEWMTKEQVLGNLLVILTSEGKLTLKEKSYIEDIK